MEDTDKAQQSPLHDFKEDMSQSAEISLDPSSTLVDMALTNYLYPVHKEYMEKYEIDSPEEGVGSVSSDENFEICIQVKQNLYQYIWGPDIFKSSRPFLKRVHLDACSKLATSPAQSDFDDMLQYHPTEVMSSKFIQLITSIALVEPHFVADIFSELDDILNNEKTFMVDNNTRDAYEFILDTMKYFFKILTGGHFKSDCRISLKNYTELSAESKGVINGLSALYMKALRSKPRERADKMKSAVNSVSGSVEWMLYFIEMLRIKRRESVRGRSKKPTPEEIHLLEQTLKLERNNPFVRWSLIDCVIDAIREFNGRFHCGDINLHDIDQAVHFLRDECRKLCDDFPKNVSFLSAVSDYFARYVPVLYFDKDFSGRLLHDAYRLNPDNPKTTHRLSILYRMNGRNRRESLNWLEKTLQLDLSNFNANMDYYKMILGQPDMYGEASAKMEKQFENIEASYWREMEKADFQFYIGLAYFAEGKNDEALQHWIEVVQKSETGFTLSDVDSDCAKFGWNSKFISTDKIREWMQEEMEKTKSRETAVCETKKKAIIRIFHLMLGVVEPKRPDPLAGPYSDRFEFALIP